MDIAAVGVAAAVTLDSDGICQSCRIALGAVAPTPIRAYQSEKILLGQKLNDSLIAKAAETAAGEAQPITDIRSTAEYRRRMIKVHVQRALQKVNKDLLD